MCRLWVCFYVGSLTLNEFLINILTPNILMNTWIVSLVELLT